MYAQAEQEAAKATALEGEWSRGFQERGFAADEAYRQQQLAVDWAKVNQPDDGESLLDNISLLGTEELDSIFTDPNQVASLIASDPKNSAKYTAMAALYKGKVSQKELRDSQQTLVDSLSDIKSKIEGLGASGRATYSTPFLTQDAQDIKTGRNIIMQQIAKLIEKNRLSDKDREFYLKNAPSDIAIMVTPSLAVKKMNSLITYFGDQFGLSGGSGKTVGDYRIEIME
jgi:hypothetical protein